MGSDGADELLLMKEKGAVTIAQDKDSCVVFGMPGEAVKVNAAMHILPPDKIAETIEHTLSMYKFKAERRL
jgi:two-component system chemotaxis response regulator CheB